MKHTFLIICCSVLIAVSIAAGEKKPAVEQPAKAEKKAETSILDKRITLEFEEISLGDILRGLGRKGLNYVVPTRLLEDEKPLSINLKDVTLREAISAIAHASGLNCKITKSGTISLAETPEAIARRNERERHEGMREMMEQKERMMERFRKFKRGKGGDERMRPDFRDKDDEHEGRGDDGEDRRRPPKKKNKGEDLHDKKEEVF